MTETDRNALKFQTMDEGESVNKLREYALKMNAPYIAGILRGVEEALKVAYDVLNDETVADKDL